MGRVSGPTGVKPWRIETPVGAKPPPARNPVNPNGVEGQIPSRIDVESQEMLEIGNTKSSVCLVGMKAGYVAAPQVHSQSQDCAKASQ